MLDMQAVRFDRCGDTDVLEVRTVPALCRSRTRFSFRSAPPASTPARRRSAVADTGGPRDDGDVARHVEPC